MGREGEGRGGGAAGQGLGTYLPTRDAIQIVLDNSAVSAIAPHNAKATAC